MLVAIDPGATQTICMDAKITTVARFITGVARCVLHGYGDRRCDRWIVLQLEQVHLVKATERPSLQVIYAAHFLRRSHTRARYDLAQLLVHLKSRLHC